MRRAVYNEQGFMAFVSPDYAERGIERGELRESEEGILMVVPQPVRQLTGLEKRALELAKQRSNR